MQGNLLVFLLKGMSPQGLLAGFAPEPATLQQAAKTFAVFRLLFRNDVQ
jgi:hypothetical protein